MKRKIYKMPKMKLPVLKYFKFNKIWQKQKFTKIEKKKIQQIAVTMDQILKNLPERNRSQLVRPPRPTYDPSVTVDEWNDFLAVALGVKPACIVGLNYKGTTYNPIGKFARKYHKIFKNLSFSDYWEFGGFDKNDRQTYDLVKDGLIYNSKLINKIIDQYPQLFQDLDLEKITSYLKKLIFNADSTNTNNNLKNFHQKIGLLLGYSKKSVDKYLKDLKQCYE